MTRTRASAKAAGSKFQRDIVAALKTWVSDYIEVAPLWGAKDKGDVVNLRTPGGRHIVVQCKNHARTDLAGWAKAAEEQRVNDSAVAGIVAHKRHGVGDPGSQWITMTVRDLVAILTEARPE